MSDNELDAELLALAGDDSSGDEDNQSLQRASRSPSQEARKTTTASRGTARKAKRQARPSGARKSRMDDSEEEGEA